MSDKGNCSQNQNIQSRKRTLDSDSEAEHSGSKTMKKTSPTILLSQSLEAAVLNISRICSYIVGAKNPDEETIKRLKLVLENGIHFLTTAKVDVDNWLIKMNDLLELETEEKSPYKKGVQPKETEALEIEDVIKGFVDAYMAYTQKVLKVTNNEFKRAVLKALAMERQLKSNLKMLSLTKDMLDRSLRQL